MRIAIVNSFYSSQASGENTAVLLQKTALEKSGHEVMLFEKHSEDESGKVFFPITAGVNVATKWGRSPRRKIEDFGADIIHVHNLFPNWSDGWLAETEIPTVSTIHNFRQICAAGTLLRNGHFCDLCPTRSSAYSVKYSCYRSSSIQSVPLAIATRTGANRTAWHQSTGLIFPSEIARLTLTRYLSPPRNATIRVIPNYVEDLHMPNTPATAKPDSPWIFSGRLSAEKGILELIRNWPDNHELVVLGDGPLREAANELSKNRNVSVLGALGRSDVFGWLAKSRGLIVPSVCLESAPTLAYVEAISSGLPVVAKSGNAVADDVMTSNSGLVFDDFAHLGRTIDKVNQSHNSFSQNARNRYVRNFSERVWISRIESLYLNVTMR